MSSGEKRVPITVSDQKTSEWIPTCPVQIKRIRLVREGDGAPLLLEITACATGDFTVRSYSADIVLFNNRKEELSRFAAESLSAAHPALVSIDRDDAIRASVAITAVDWSGGIWQNEEKLPGKNFPEQEILWQTDPHYRAIRSVCEGIVDAKYRPDTVEGGWRCACGQVNRTDAVACGACGCSHAWLKEHFAPAYLEEAGRELEQKAAEVKPTKPKKQRQGMGDGVKALLILLSIVLAVTLIVLTVTVFVPAFRYQKAEAHFAADELEEAEAIFRDLDDYRDAADRLKAVIYRKAQVLTGLENVRTSDSSVNVWYTIDENGRLSFRRDLYKGDWTTMVIPDVVDGIMVRELDENFFMNCKSIETIILSECVEVIGAQAFYACDALKLVEFGKNVKTVGSRAFAACIALEEIAFPDSVEDFGLRMFNNCTALRSVTLGKGITTIGDYTFSMCSSLETLTLASPIQSIGEGGFHGCTNLKTVRCLFDPDEMEDVQIGEDNAPFAGVEKVQVTP